MRGRGEDTEDRKSTMFLPSYMLNTLASFSIVCNKGEHQTGRTDEILKKRKSQYTCEPQIYLLILHINVLRLIASSAFT